MLYQTFLRSYEERIISLDNDREFEISEGLNNTLNSYANKNIKKSKRICNYSALKNF